MHLIKIKNIIRLLALIPLCYGLLLVLIYFFHYYFIFQPVTLKADYAFQFDHPFEERFLRDDSGQQINTLYFKTNQTAKGVVLYLHGNADNLQRWAAYHTDFTQRAYDVFFMDYNGYGKSEGQPSEAALYANARMAYDWLRPKYDTMEIIIYGRSLGTAPASWLATQVNSRMLILETPFNNIQGAIAAHLPFRYLPFDIPIQLPNDQHLREVSCPVYIFQGTKDLIVPHSCAAELQPLLKSKDRWITVEGGAHKNLRTFEKYQTAMDQILLGEE